MDWHDVNIQFWPGAEPVAGAVTPPPAQSGVWAGDKFHGGFGATQLYQMDYWELRMRSGQLFHDNLYARGLLRRMVTNEINVGLALEAKPEEKILGVGDDSLSDWSEEVETRFALWGKDASLCDYFGERTFGALQRQIRLESIIDGDVLVVLDIDRVTGLPKVRLVNASKVRTPLNTGRLAKTHTIEHGVELDSKKRQVAYWVDQADGTTKRVPRIGRRSGRRVAWLVYGTERRLDDVRGEPLLSLILQSLKELDRYRDAALRKAVINSILAMFIQKDVDKPGTLSMTGGAVRRDQVTPTDTVNPDRTFDITQHVPGLFMQELQTGEKPVPHSTAGTDVNFGPFEESVVRTLAWANEMPPEILQLLFGSNYAASQGAVNEYKLYLNMRRSEFGDDVPQVVYIEWLISSVLQRKITAVGLLEAWRDPLQYDIYGAWIGADWCGANKPSADVIKQAKGYKIMVGEGWMTNARAARELTNTKYCKNIGQLKRENELKAEAMLPLAVETEDTGGDEEDLD